jgi:hypothetical protein
MNNYLDFWPIFDLNSSAEILVGNSGNSSCAADNNI